MKFTICITVEEINKINGRSLEAALNQTIDESNYKVIFVNHLNDFSANYYFNKYSLKFNNLEQITVSSAHKENMKNEVIEKLESDFVIFLDPGTIVSENMLEEFLKMSKKSQADMIVAHEQNERFCRKKDRMQAKIIEDQLLANVNRVVMYKTEHIRNNKFLYEPESILSRTLFFIKYFINTDSVAKINNQSLFEIESFTSCTSENIGESEYLEKQGEILSLLTTAQRMTTEDKIKAISQYYLTILHGDICNTYIKDTNIDPVDRRIWLRKFSEFTNRYLPDASIDYISKFDRNMVRAIKNNNLVAIDFHKKNLSLTKKIKPELEAVTKKVIVQANNKQHNSDLINLEKEQKVMDEKLKVIEARINKVMGR